MIGRLKPTEEGAGLQFPGRIIRRKFENKQHEVIGAGNLGQTSTQKINVEISRSNSTIEIDEIDQRGHREKYLLLEVLRPPWDLSITSHESDCR